MTDLRLIHETAAVAWLPLADVLDVPLHPGLVDTRPRLLRALLRVTLWDPAGHRAGGRSRGALPFEARGGGIRAPSAAVVETGVATA